MAKREYLRRHRKKRGPNSGKKSSFFNLDLIKSNGRVLVAFLMFGAESRICSFEKRNIIFLSFFYYDFDCGLFSFFLRRAGSSSTIVLLLVLGRKQTIVDVCCTFNNVCQVQFFCLCIKRPLF